MKLFAIFAMLLAGCADPEIRKGHWVDMQTDILLRHKLERYSCAYHSLEGFTKENCKHSRGEAAPKPVAAKAQESVVKIDVSPGKTQELEHRVDELEAATSQHSDVLNKLIKANQVIIQRITPTPTP